MPSLAGDAKPCARHRASYSSLRYSTTFTFTPVNWDHGPRDRRKIAPAPHNSLNVPLHTPLLHEWPSAPVHIENIRPTAWSRSGEFDFQTFEKPKWKGELCGEFIALSKPKQGAKAASRRQAEGRPQTKAEQSRAEQQSSAAQQEPERGRGSSGGGVEQQVGRMCWKKQCEVCNKWTIGGCGRHRESALSGVKEEDRCHCSGPAGVGARNSQTNCDVQ